MQTRIDLGSKEASSFALYPSPVPGRMDEVSDDYEPILIRVGPWPVNKSSDHAYTLEELRAWSQGDLSSCHEQPRGIIAALALAIVTMIEEGKTPSLEPYTEAGFAIQTGLAISWEDRRRSGR